MAALFSEPPTVISASGTSPAFRTDSITTLAIDATSTTIVGSGAITLFVERQGSDGLWYSMNGAGTAISTATATSLNIGPGTANQSVLTAQARLRWVLTGTSITVSFSVQGR